MNKLIIFIKNFISVPELLVLFAILISLITTYFSYINGYTIAYGDSESHLNIAKRVIASPTPGFSQLGGIWLPLPHLMMIPFVFFDPLWRSGIAGSIVSGFFYIVSSIFIYKLVLLITKNKLAGVVGFFVFALNPNILYLQTTSMSELPLIGFFVLSTYYFIKFLEVQNLGDLIIAAFFAFAASLTRYDGWFLVAVECLTLIIFIVFKKARRSEWFSNLILFTTPAAFGILLWFLWGFLILGDALYFSNSPFSAKSQQQGWLLRGELPAYKNVVSSFLYYAYTSALNIGIFAAALALCSAVFFIMKRLKQWYVFLIISVPFVFYVVTLYLGQSIIFIPQLTPSSFEWNLFNARYGIMMVPAAAFFIAFLFARSYSFLKVVIILILVVQGLSFYVGRENIITLSDGIHGLSSYKKPDVQQWLIDNYDGGYVLLDDYARTVSVIRTTIPLQKVIYVGNKPYWENSLKNPEKYDSWIVMQKGDAVWKNFIDNPKMEKHLYKYYNKAYTSSDILVFKRISDNKTSMN